jgi:hypothetical protein
MRTEKKAGLSDEEFGSRKVQKKEGGKVGRWEKAGLSAN